MQESYVRYLVFLVFLVFLAVQVLFSLCPLWPIRFRCFLQGAEREGRFRGPEYLGASAIWDHVSSFHLLTTGV